MKTLFIISILASTFLGCAKKVAPAATIDNKPATETKTVTETKPVIVTPVESSMSISGHVIYDVKCGLCHALKKPGDFTVEQWVPILDDMASRAKLDSTEKANVRAYVRFYAKPAK